MLKHACTDPSQPDSRDVAFGVVRRIDAAGRMAHPAEALAVFEAALDQKAARQSVDRLNQLNAERRRTVKVHFEKLVESIGTKRQLVWWSWRDEPERDRRPPGEQMCREVFGSQHHPQNRDC